MSKRDALLDDLRRSYQLAFWEQMQGKTAESLGINQITGGLLESFTDGTYDAIVQTNTDRRRITNRDSSQPAFELDLNGSYKRIRSEIAERFDNAVDKSDPTIKTNSLIEISNIWEQLDNLSNFASTKSLLLLRQLPQQKASVPEKFEVFRAQLGDLERSQVETLLSLLRELDDQIELPNVEVSLFGKSLVVEWDMGTTQLQWEILESDLPYPGLNVRTMILKSNVEALSVPETRIYHHSYGVIEQFLNVHRSADDREMSRNSKGPEFSARCNS